MLTTLARRMPGTRVVIYPAPVQGQGAARRLADAIGVERLRVERARRERDEVLSGDLFADPAWDMLLALYEIAISDRKITVTELCNASRVPQTTALRWTEALIERGTSAKKTAQNNVLARLE